MNAREDILGLFSGNGKGVPPAFSGLIHVTAEGLASEGLSFHEVHHDAGKMARAAASTFNLTQMPSAALPLDLCSPAEALGAELVFYGGEEMQFPQVKRLLFQSTKEILETGGTNTSRVSAQQMGGRLGMICEAIRLVKRNVGDRIVVSGIVPGPYTLMIYICKAQNLFREMKDEPQAVLDALFCLSSFLSDIGNAYLEAGADFITIHEMGGSPGFIGPAKFEQFVLPSLQRLHQKINGKRVLSVCGKTDAALSQLARAGADAISVDQMTDLKTAREALGDVLLFGNVDPVGILQRGDKGSVAEAVQRSKEAGVDAVWPGCDLVPQTPLENIKSMTGAN